MRAKQTKQKTDAADLAAAVRGAVEEGAPLEGALLKARAEAKAAEKE